MGGGFSRRRNLLKQQQLNQNGGQAQEGNNIEIKDEEQLQKELEQDILLQQSQQSQVQEKSARLFIGNQDEYERDGQRVGLSLFLKMDEQSKMKKNQIKKKGNKIEEEDDEDLIDEDKQLKNKKNTIKYPFPPEEKTQDARRQSMNSQISKSRLNGSSVVLSSSTKENTKKESEPKRVILKVAQKDPVIEKKVVKDNTAAQSTVPKVITLQQLREDVSMDLSRELQQFSNQNTNNMKLPDFSLDISAIYPIEKEQETPQQQEARIKDKIKKLNKQQTEQAKVKNIPRGFNWPKQGECKIMSVNFKVVYSSKDLDLKMTKSYDFHTASSLTWKWNSSLQIYEFILQDNSIFNAQNTSTTALPNNIISFIVAKDGQFVCIKDENDFITKVRKNQTAIEIRAESTSQSRSKKNLSQKNETTSSASKLEKSKVIEETEKSMKLLWSNSITDFLENKGDKTDKSKQEDNTQQSKSSNDQTIKREVVTSITHNKYNCKLIQRAAIQPREKLETFLKDNLTSNEKYFNFCFNNPKKTIRDKLKVWGIIDENSNEIELMPNKFRFPVLRKHEIQTGIIEEKGNFLRPHTITNDSCKIIVIDHKRDLFADVEQDIKLSVFLWPERGDNQNEIHFYEELSKFKDLCDEALKNIVLDLSRVRALPSSYKPKLKKKYFELY